MAAPSNRRIKYFQLLALPFALSFLSNSAARFASDSDAAALWREIIQIRHTQPERATQLSERAYQDNRLYSAAWRWRFRVRHAELLLDQGIDTNKNKARRDKLLAEIVALEKQPLPVDLPANEAAARLASLTGYFPYREDDDEKAEAFFEKAIASASAVKNDPCWEAELRVHHQAQTLQEMGKYSQAIEAAKQAQGAADSCPDKAYSALIPFVQGNCANSQFHYEEAVGYFQKCLDSSKLPSLAVTILGTMGLCYYNLGDTDHALEKFDEADKYYRGLGRPLTNRELKDWEHHKGHRARTYLLLQKYDAAKRAYTEAMQDAKDSDDSQFLMLWRTELTSLYIETGEYDLAQKLNAEVLKDVNAAKDPFGASRAYLNEARLNRLKKHYDVAARQLQVLQRQLANRKDPKIIWQVHSEQARIFGATGHFSEAQREFQAALTSAQAARNSVKADDYRLTDFAELRNIYQAYVGFLAQHGKIKEALQYAELGHASLLAEKLRSSSPNSTAKDFTQIARAKSAVILSYSISAQDSYLWATTAGAVQMFPLTIDSTEKLERLIHNHNLPIREGRPISEDVGGQSLYQLLVSPAQSLIKPGSNVIVIPDGPLSGLNFETLIPPDPKTHYWIETVNIQVAPSLMLLKATSQTNLAPDSILLAGDAVPTKQEKLLPLGHADLDYISNLYSDRCQMLRQQQATPRAFLKAAAEKPHSWIYLSAHAQSFAQSPLDSYVVLSPETNGGDYKLSARELMKLGLHANLVALSACQSAGAKNIPGEGLVGLSWAVLGSGALNVVASLWNVEAEATTNLMKRFYGHLHEREPPAQALRSAKLEMIRANQRPATWAAFQIYSR